MTVEATIIEKIARHYMRRTFGRDIDDLRQQAAQVLEEARPRWRPDVGVSLEDYLSRACYLGVGRYLYQNSTTVSIPINNARKVLTGLRVVVTEDHETVVQKQDAPPFVCRTPLGVHDMEAEYIEADWRERARSYIVSVVAPLAYGPAVLAVLLDGQPVKDVAANYGTETETIYRAIAEAKRALFTAQSRSLVRELKR